MTYVEIVACHVRCPRETQSGRTFQKQKNAHIGMAEGAELNVVYLILRALGRALLAAGIRNTLGKKEKGTGWSSETPHAVDVGQGKVVGLGVICVILQF